MLEEVSVFMSERSVYLRVYRRKLFNLISFSVTCCSLSLEMDLIPWFLKAGGGRLAT